MKRFLSSALLIAAVAFGLAACAAPPLGVTSPATVSSAQSTSPHGAQIGKAMQEVTLSRQAFTKLAQAGKITWAQDDAAQAALTSIRKDLEQAQTVDLTNPAQAAQLLASALNALAAYQGAGT